MSASGCGQGNIHFFAAGAAVEIKGVESSGSNRGVWSQTPSHKVLITDSFLHHNGADGVDLDSMSANVMVRNNRIENNHRAGVFIEEGASDNVNEFILSRFVPVHLANPKSITISDRHRQHVLQQQLGRVVLHKHGREEPGEVPNS